MTGRNCVLGADLFSGSPLSRTNRPLYSLVYVCEDGRDIRKWTKVPIARLLRLSWELKPKIIAIDSPQELAPDIKGLTKVAELLPPETQLVMVNIDGHDMARSLLEVAKEHGLIEARKKPNSLQTAYILAMLAIKGAGRPLLSRDEMTKIVIRRSRVEGKGGMSSNRYKRKVRGVIKQLAKEVQYELQRKGVDFEIYYKKSVGGLEKAVFIVYAPIGEVEKAIRTRELQDASIEIKPVIRLAAQDEERENQPIIVGVDPGYNFGIAIIDIDGRPLHIETIREANRAEVMDLIRKYGKCVTIATDVYPVPEIVKKLASSLMARVYTPGEAVESSIKREIVASYLESQRLSVRDNHSRDALAAALLAHREVKKKLSEIENYLNKTGLNIPLRRVQIAVASGMSLANAIEDAIDDMLLSSERIMTFREISSEREEGTRKLIGLLERIKLEKELLERELEKKEKAIERLERELREKTASVINQEMTERKEGLIYKSLAKLSNKTRELEERLEAEILYKGFLIEKMALASLKKLSLIPSCSYLIRYSSQGSGKIEYCFVEKLTEVSPPDIGKLNVKAVISTSDVECMDREDFYENGIGVICNAIKNYNCENVDGKVLVCDYSILQSIAKEAEKAGEVKAERERAKIYRILMEYKKDKLKRDHSDKMAPQL